MAKEPIEDLLAGRTPARLPWLPELNDGFVRKVMGLPPDSAEPYWPLSVRAARRIGADHLRRVTSVKTVRRRVTLEERDGGMTRIWHTPKGDLRRVQEPAPASGTVFTREHPIKGPESFAAFAALVEDEQYAPDYAAAQAEIAEADLATIDVPATPLMHLLMWEMDVQPTLMAMLDHRQAMLELIGVMHERNKEYYRLASAGPGRVLRPMEDTSAMLTGPTMYAEVCVSQLNDYAAIAHAAGKLFIPHMCGHLGQMLDVLAEVELDGIEAITPPPLGNADLADMRRRLGEIWLIGGVAPSMYATAAPEAFAAHVRGALQTMRGDRKFMLGHEEIPLAAKMENVRIAARLAADTAGWFYK